MEAGGQTAADINLQALSLLLGNLSPTPQLLPAFWWKQTYLELRLPLFWVGFPESNPDALHCSVSTQGFQECVPALVWFAHSPSVSRACPACRRAPHSSHCFLPSPFISAATRS